MEYTIKKLKNGLDCLCVINSERLSGDQVFTKEYSDMIITDSFTIESFDHEEININGDIYDWYIIKNRTKIIDRATLLAKQNKADVDYLAMMTGIDIDNEV